MLWIKFTFVAESTLQRLVLLQCYLALDFVISHGVRIYNTFGYTVFFDTVYLL